MQEPTQEQHNNWIKDPKNWKCKMFYYNKADNRVFLEKPNPMYGITMNFANKKTYTWLVGSFLFFGFIIYMIETRGAK